MNNNDTQEHTMTTYTPKMAKFIATATDAGYIVVRHDNCVDIASSKHPAYAVSVRVWLDRHTKSGAVGFVAGNRTDVDPNVATNLTTIAACATVLGLSD